MLTDIELKEKLLAKITDTDNINLLQNIEELIEFEKEHENIYILSPEEREAVMDGINQIESGRFVTNEEANRRIAECFKK